MIIRGSASVAALRAAPLVAVALLMTLIQGVERGVLTWWGYLCLGLAALSAASLVAQLFWPPTLSLGADTLVCRWWWSTTKIPWSDIEAFRVIRPRDQLSGRLPHLLPWNVAIARIGAKPKIGLDYREGVTLSPALQQSRWAFQARDGCDWAVLNLWNLSALELVSQMNEQLAASRHR